MNVKDLVYGIVIIAILMVFFGTCQGYKKEINALKLKSSVDLNNQYLRDSTLIESVRQQNADLTTNFRKYKNWAVDTISELGDRADSITKSYKNNTKSLEGLLNRAQEYAKKHNDTALAGQVAVFRSLYFETNRQVDSLRALDKRQTGICEVALAEAQRVIDKKDSIFTAHTQHVLDSTIVLRERLTSATEDLKTQLRKNTKRWAIGPHLGYGIDGTGKGSPTLGISIQRTLFKF